MMHFNRPWIHHQQMVVEQPYYQYTVNDLQAYYSSSDHQEEDNDHTGDEMPSETSGDQSPHGDMFRLAFAASQWSKLVLNAEGLFNKLMSTNVLPSNEQNLLKNQIEQWLCMKQEYEECITGDDSGSLQGYTENARRSLERIEEVTETDEKTDESNNWIKLQSREKSCSDSESDVYDDEDQSDLESEDPDFLDKLDEYMKKFKNETDEIIDSKKNDFSKNVSPVPKSASNSSFVSIVKPTPVRNQASRRTSILPYSEMSNELAEFQKQSISSSNVQKDQYNEHILPFMNGNENRDNKEKFNNNNKSFEEETMAIVKAKNVDIDPEILSTLKVLRINNEEKTTQIKKIQFVLEFAYKQYQELQNVISRKEKFIEEILESCDARNSVKQKLQKKRSKIEEKYRNTEKVLNYKRMHRDTEDESAYNDEIKKYERSLLYYEKKLKDTKLIHRVAGDSAKKVLYLKDSLSASKKQMEKLKQRIKEEEEQKKALEDELLVNKKRIKEIEDKYGLKAKKWKELLSESEDERNYSRFKIKSDDKSSVETNERISRLDHLSKGKFELDRIDNADDKEKLRQEIQHLRQLRDHLIDRKCSYTSDRICITVEKQRHVLVISEFVETIDALIEQKNVMICGKSNFNENKSSDKLEERGRKIIGLLIEKLPHDELVILFYNYFYKVVDLKESSKNLEIQNATLEESLKQQKIKHDIAMIELQKSHEQRINVLLGLYAEENSSSSYDNYDNGFDRNKDFERLVKENQALRRRLAHFDSLFKPSGTTKAVRSNSAKTSKQVLKSELMQLALPPKTTKVTRQGNKLIFQTSEKEK